jgi:hypothetical protein
MIATNEGTDAVRTVDAIICGLSRPKGAPTRRQPASWFLPAVPQAAGEVLLRLLASRHWSAAWAHIVFPARQGKACVTEAERWSRRHTLAAAAAALAADLAAALTTAVTVAKNGNCGDGRHGSGRPSRQRVSVMYMLSLSIKTIQYVTAGTHGEIRAR